MTTKREIEMQPLWDAIAHLRADLVWSDDFDAVRDNLALLLEQIATFLPDSERRKNLEPALSWLIADLMGD